MIEQQRYPIESVPKYNFSDSVAGGLGLPMGFVELCLSSLKKLHEQPMRSSLGKQTLESYGNETVLKFNLKDAPVEVIPLHAIQEDVSVAAVDVSSMRIGETEEGMLIAVRGAVVWDTRRRYRYLRLGPFIFHITEDNKNYILSLLCKHHFDIPDDERVTPDPFHLPTRIAGILEKWIQMNLCVASSNSLILFDGSLTAGTPDAPENTAVKLLQTARTRANTVLAFSKSSRLHFNGHLLTDVASKCTPPCLVKINGLLEPRMGSFKLIGDIYVAKLAEDAVSFRLDIDKELEQSHAVDAVQRLLGNDLMYQGYPETLRLAHIYSTFTANEVIGMQRYLAQDCGLKIQVKPNLRRLLFGPFGKGPEG